GSGGTTTLRLRYALGATTPRTGQLVVNGASQTITFNPTGAWTTWVTLDVAVSLASSSGNTVRLQSTGQDLANIDELSVGGAVTPTPTPSPPTGRQMEDLNRGLVRINQGSGNFISWRMLGTDPASIAFNVYRGTTRINASPLTSATSLTDSA